MDYELDKTAETIKKYLGMPNSITLENNKGEKADILMSPLPCQELPAMYGIMSKMKGIEEDQTLFFEKATPQVIEQIANLALKALKPNYPEVDDMLLKDMVIRNLMLFYFSLIGQNLYTGINITEEKVNLIKEKQEQARAKKNAGS